MPVYYGCDLPDDLLFDVERDVWVRYEPDGTATLGMTDISQTRCGKVINMMFKKVGKVLNQGGAAATVESAKWVGPFPMPFSGEIVATNEDTFRRDILIMNKDPYGEGWLVKVRPTDPNEPNQLLQGDAAFEAYKQRINDLEVRCLRCVDESMD
jgi:glycine cleavage system H protein